MFITVQWKMCIYMDFWIMSCQNEISQNISPQHVTDKKMDSQTECGILLYCHFHQRWISSWLWSCKTNNQCEDIPISSIQYQHLTSYWDKNMNFNQLVTLTKSHCSLIIWVCNVSPSSKCRLTNFPTPAFDTQLLYLLYLIIQM